MKKLVICFLLNFVAFSANAGGTFEEMAKKQAACGELSSLPYIAGCHHSLLEESDALLNKEYTKLTSYLSGANKQNLIDAQRKWVKFRDADCRFIEPRNEEEGSVVSANKFSCLADRTIERLKRLEDYNSDQYKGCNGCPW